MSVKPSYEELEARCAALAAENAVLKVACGGDGSYIDCPACAHSEYIEAPETPSTDAFLAEVRAQGVEMSMNRIHETGSLTFGDCYIALNGLVDEILRKGVQS